MRLVTKNIIRQIFADIAEAFYQINSFGYGPADEFVQKTMDENDQELEGTIIYPRLYVTPEPSTITGKRINRNYTIVVADLVRKGRENMTEAESDTEQILTDVIAQIQDQAYGFQLDIGSISIVPFTGRFVDEVTGHYAEVSLYSGFEFDRCQIPSEFISISNPYIPLDEEGTNERDPLSWHKVGNTLTASSVIGSNNDQDWRIIHNNVTIGTVQAIGLTINGAIDYTTGAIQSLNGLTDKVQTFAIGSAGTDFNLVSAAGVHTFNIPDAGVGITGGLVTNAAQTFEGVKTFASAPILTGFTQGSVLFAGVGGVVSQDNANLFFDNVNNYLGLGIAVPTRTIHSVGNGVRNIATYTATANNDYGWNFTGTLTARATASDILNGVLINPTLVASAATQILAAVNINPTFTAGAFSPTTYALYSPSTGRNYFLGNVGIGKLPTIVALDILGTITSTSNSTNNLILESSATTDSQVQIRAGGNPKFLYGWTYNAGVEGWRLFNYQNTATSFFLHAVTSNIIIGGGAVAPSARLHVVGSDATTANYVAKFYGLGLTNGPEIRNDAAMILGRLAADPASPINGMIYYNTATNKFRGYEGGAWANLI